MSSKQILIIIISLLAFTPTKTKATNFNSTVKTTIPKYSDDEYETRLQNISTTFDFRFDSKVKDRIYSMTTRAKRSTEQLLGLGGLYFPIFERHLLQYNLPTQLKYIPVIESRLNPRAVSPVGAGGMWQFMPSTGRGYGLYITDYVDDRYDPIRSSEAAAKMLSRLYDRYEDWALVLAAYNCGAGRVNRAIKQSGSTNFYELKRYLPKETQYYIPKFIAAVYVGNYYHLHNLNPVYLPYEYQITDTLHIYDGMSFDHLSKMINVSVETIKFLNPSFRRNYIPRNSKGYTITLPVEELAAYKGYQPAPLFKGVAMTEDMKDQASIRFLHKVSVNDNLEKIASLFNCTIEELRVWNNLPVGAVISEGDVIAIRSTKISTSKHQEEQPEVKKEVLFLSRYNNYLVGGSRLKDGLVYHEVQRGDNLWRIANQYQGISVKQIMELNNIQNTRNLKVGKYIAIAKI